MGVGLSGAHTLAGPSIYTQLTDTLPPSSQPSHPLAPPCTTPHGYIRSFHPATCPTRHQQTTSVQQYLQLPLDQSLTVCARI